MIHSFGNEETEFLRIQLRRNLSFEMLSKMPLLLSNQLSKNFHDFGPRAETLTQSQSTGSAHCRKSIARLANGQRPTRQYFPPGSGCLISLWPLAVALSSDEI